MLEVPQIIGLVLSLAASPILLALFKRLSFKSWAFVPRFNLWILTGLVLTIAAMYVDDWYTRLGIVRLGWLGIAWFIVAATAILMAMGVDLYIQQKLDADVQKQTAEYQALLGRSFGYRCFIVVTAAVTEEVLYRAYAIGVGQFVVGSLWVACLISVVAFTLAHIRWGAAHLAPVLISAVVLTLLFVFTHNLWLCVIAHAIVDGAGFLLMPAITRRRAQSANGLA